MFLFDTYFLCLHVSVPRFVFVGFRFVLFRHKLRDVLLSSCVVLAPSFARFVYLCRGRVVIWNIKVQFDVRVL